MVRVVTKLLLLFGLYLLLTGQTSIDELVAAALCALAAAALSVAIPLVAQRHFAFRGVAWLRLIGGTLTSLMADLARVGLHLARLRIPSGNVQRWAFATGTAQAPDTARRGLVTAATSVAPNTYVLVVLTGRQEVLVHQLVGAEPPQDRDWLQ